jgi:hypothetical protein
MRQECRTLAQQGGTTTPEVTGGAPLSRLDRRLWEQATAQYHGNLGRIDRVVCGVAARDGFHGEGMAQDTGEFLVSAEIGEPIPGAQAFDRDDQPRTIGGNGLEERFRSGFHGAVPHDFTVVAHDADVHGTRMQVDTAVTLVGGGVESPEVSSFLGSP